MCILRSQFCLQYKTIQRFCKTWHALNFNFNSFMKCNLETRIFYLCPTLPNFWKIFLTTDQSTFQKEKFKDEYFDVARTRKCAECGSDEARTPTLHEVTMKKLKFDSALAYFHSALAYFDSALACFDSKLAYFDSKLAHCKQKSETDIVDIVWI